ncbi:MAG TPA: hypothetical protein VGI45_22660 [Terracidiphilus sp.]
MSTAETFAENVALVAPAGTVTEAGTVSAEVLLERLTSSPLVGAALFVVTVQVSVPDPLTLVLAQLNPLRAADPVDPLPCNLTVVPGVAEAPVMTLS